MIREEIDIPELIEWDTDPLVNNTLTRWNLMGVGQCFKKRRLDFHHVTIIPHAHTHDTNGWMVCIKIDNENYIHIVWMGNAYIRVDEYWWGVL